MRAGILSWYEPDSAHDRRISRRPPESAWLRYEEVSEGLRRALEAGRWPLGRGLAIGIGPDGAEYAAAACNGLVLIHECPLHGLAPIPIAEPDGVVWKPILTLPATIGPAPKS